jgi:S1-C subfamily serine protease
VQVTTLTPELSKATGAPSGVVVAYVDERGPAAAALAPGDVVMRIGSQAVGTPAAYAAVVAALAPNTPVPLQIVRNAAESSATVTPVPIPAGPGAPAPVLGLGLRGVRGAGSEVVSVAQHSAGERAGLLRGDLITAFAGAEAPDPVRIARLFRDAPAGTSFVVVVQRGEAHLVIGLPKP